MTTPEDLKKKFWKALSSDRTLMLGLDGREEGHTRPMTAVVENDRSPIWFFTAADNALAMNLEPGGRAIAAFASKGHDVFATIHGRLVADKDRAVIDRLWNPFIAAWYKGGKDDPKLALLRFDADRAEIWLNDSGIFTGIKLLLGADPRKDYKDHVAEVSL